MRTVPLFFFIFLGSLLAAQTTGVNDKLLRVSVDNLYEQRPAKRKLLKFKKKAAYFNPLSYAGAGLLYFYQNLLSEQIQADCSYAVSCSEFTKLSIQRYGIFIGTFRGVNQLSECFGGARYEHPRLFLNSNNKIINDVHE